MRKTGIGLAAVHAHGLIHRDVTPNNIMITDSGHVVLMDFGLSLYGHLGHTPQNIAGTPGYIAPETYSHREVSVRSDQFSFAVTAWEALHEERPFETTAEPAHCRATHPELRRRSNPRGVPRRLRSGLQRALEPDPGRRWSEMNALLQAFEAPRKRQLWLATGVGYARRILGRTTGSQHPM